MRENEEKMKRKEKGGNGRANTVIANQHTLLLMEEFLSTSHFNS